MGGSDQSHSPLSRHYTFGLKEPRKGRKAKSLDESHAHFEHMIISSGPERGSHLLFNGPCDVIGKQVMELITSEFNWNIGYFRFFPKEIRPIHCAILLRNERIVKALIESNLDMTKIKEVCDFKAQAAYRTELRKLVSLPVNYPLLYHLI